MKVLHIGKRGNMERYSAPGSALERLETADMPMGLPAEDYLAVAADAEFLVADAIAAVPAALIDRMPNLRLIHSEGVAYNAIDLAAARRRHIYVCNSQGMNAAAVAEQTLLLMLGMLRDVAGNDHAVRQGRQIQVKEGYMQRGDLREIADCTVGLVGYGDIARKTAALLRAHGAARILCCKRTPLTPEQEAAEGVSCLPLETLLSESDIVSLHVPMNGENRGLANDAFFSQMREGSFFVNTARGELVDDGALIRALESGRLRMAALDTVDGEPVGPDHPLLRLPPQLAGRILFSPHIGGITAASFRRSYAMIWEDVQAVMEGRRPERVVDPW